MSRRDLLTPFPWHDYSPKIGEKLENLRYCGVFLSQETDNRGIRLVEGREGSLEEGGVVILYLLVDLSDGVIADARYQVFGHAALIAAAEAACELLIRKNYDQAHRISADLIEKKLRTHAEEPAFPEEVAGDLNVILGAIDNAIEKCRDIPLGANYISPVPSQLAGAEGYPGWKLLPREEKIAVIEKVLEEEVRPYVELDEGGVSVLDLINDREVIISYQGNCTSCFSAVGATLSTIQQILQAKVDGSLVVVPNMDNLKI